MKLALSILICLALSSTAAAQIKKWTDEKGVVHFESQGTAKESAPRDKSRVGEQPGNAKVTIERSHKGLTLGDNDSSYRNSRDWAPIGTDQFGAEGFAGVRIQDATKAIVLFVDQRLWSINVTYPETVLGSWDRAVQNTTAKYGQPKTNGSEATWRDGQTLLSLKKDDRGEIEVMLVDNDLSQRYSSRAGRAAPKF